MILQSIKCIYTCVYIQCKNMCYYNIAVFPVVLVGGFGCCSLLGAAMIRTKCSQLVPSDKLGE